MKWQHDVYGTSTVFFFFRVTTNQVQPIHSFVILEGSSPCTLSVLLRHFAMTLLSPSTSFAYLQALEDP